MTGATPRDAHADPRPAAPADTRPDDAPGVGPDADRDAGAGARPGSHQGGSEAANPHERGAIEAEPGGEETGAEEAGAEETGAEETGGEQAGGAEPVAGAGSSKDTTSAHTTSADAPSAHASLVDRLDSPKPADQPHAVELSRSGQHDDEVPISSRPGTIPRAGIVLLVIAAGWLSVTAVRNLQGIVGPLLLTLNLVIVAYPVQAKLNRLGVPRVLGACVSALIVFAIVIAFFSALGWSMAMLVQEIPGYQQQFSALYQSGLEQLARIGVSETQAMAQLQAQLNPSRVVGFATSTLSGLTGALSMLLVTVTIIFVVLIDSMQLGTRLQVAARSHDDIVAALLGFARGVRRYWIVSSIFGAIVAALDVVALLQLGVPLAFVWGLLSFLTNYIPNIGFVLGIVPPALMALMANGPQTALFVVIAYCVINFVIQSIIMPKYLGDAVGVTATVSLLSLLFWAWVLGPLGALLALPATLLCKALLVDLDPRLRWLDAFISSHPEDSNQLTPKPEGA